LLTLSAHTQAVTGTGYYLHLKNITILITGGASGIGLAARLFLALGAKVIITGRNRAKLDAAIKAYPAITALKSDAGNKVMHSPFLVK